MALSGNPIAYLLARERGGPSLPVTAIVAGVVAGAGSLLLVLAQRFHPILMQTVFTNPAFPFTVTPNSYAAVTPLVRAARLVGVGAWPLSALVCGMLGAAMTRHTDAKMLYVRRLTRLKAPVIVQGYTQVVQLRTRLVWAVAAALFVVYIVAVMLHYRVMLTADPANNAAQQVHRVLEVAFIVGMGLMMLTTHRQMMTAGVWAGLAFPQGLQSHGVVLGAFAVTAVVTVLLGALGSILTCGVSFAFYLIAMKAITDRFARLAADAIRR